MKASVGRVVHYMSLGSAGGEYPAVCRAAVVTEVRLDLDDSERVGLAVLNPTGLFFDREIRYDEHRVPGTWHWPERVDE